MKNQIPSINGLRALSIFFVLFAHIQLMDFGKNDIPGGQIGVNIFFLISGYLITFLLLKEEKAHGTISLKGFYFRRTIRIFPVYYFVLLVYFILQIFGILYFTTESWVSSITYTKYFPYKNLTDWETGHFWSLSIEEHFYLIWPFVFKYLKKYRLAFSLVVIIAIALTRLITNVSSFNIITRGDAIVIGCVFAMFNQQISSYINSEKNKLVLLIPFALLFCCVAFKRIVHVPDSINYSNAIRAFIGSYGIVTNVCIGMILLISINLKNNIWFRFLNLHVMNYIGKLSYSIYIWQQLFFSVKIGFFSKFPINLLFIFIVANLSYYLIEKPFLKLKSKKVKSASVSAISI